MASGKALDGYGHVDDAGLIRYRNYRGLALAFASSFSYSESDITLLFPRPDGHLLELNQAMWQ